MRSNPFIIIACLVILLSSVSAVSAQWWNSSDIQYEVIDDFEDGDISEWSGDTDKWETVSSTKFNGDYYVRHQNTGNWEQLVRESDFSANNYTMKFQVEFPSKTVELNNAGVFSFGAPTINEDNHYQVQYQQGYDEWALVKWEDGSNTVLDDISDSTSSVFDNIHNVTIAWHEDNTIDVRIIDTSDGETFELSAVDSTYTSGYIKLRSPKTMQVDYIRLGDEVTNQPPQYFNEQPANASTGVPLHTNVSLNVTDPDGDDMNVTVRDASDGSVIGTATNVPNGSTATVEWAGLEQATTYRWFANVSDGDAYNVTGTHHFTTGQTLDSPPVVVSTQVSNTSPQANERVAFNATCQDRDQTNFTGYCRIHFNGTAGNLTSVSPVYNDTSTEFCSVTTANNSKDHSYFAEVWCEDENGNASHVNTSEATVIDTPPEAPDDILFPGDIKVSKDLNATSVGGYDIDGDPINYYYRYENIDDSTALKNWSDNNSYIINQSDAHDELFVSAKSVTPDANSSSINRSPQVQNTIPVIQAVRNNTQGVVETPVTYNLSITDIDGDSPYDIDVSVRTDSAQDVFARLENISSQEQFNISVPAEYNGDTELYFQASDAYGGNSNYSTDRLHLYGANVTVKFYDETGGSIDIGGYSVFSCADQEPVSSTTDTQHYLLNCTPEWYEFRQNNTELSRRYVVGPGTFTQDVYMFDALVTEAIPKPIDVDDMFDEDVYVLRYGTVVHSEHQDNLGRIYPFLAYGRRYQIGVMQDGKMTTIGEVTATDDSLLVTYLSSYDTDLREESYYKDISIQSGFTENGIYINYTDASETTEYVEATIQYLDNGTYEQSYVSRVNYQDQVMFLHPFTENESRLKNVTQWRITVESKTTYGTITEKTYLSYLEDLALPGVGAAIKTIIGLGVVILIAGLFTVQNGEIGVMFASAVLMVFKTIGLFQYPDFMVYGIGSLFFLLGVFALLKRHGVL